MTITCLAQCLAYSVNGRCSHYVINKNWLVPKENGQEDVQPHPSIKKGTLKHFTHQMNERQSPGVQGVGTTGSKIHCYHLSERGTENT